mgnify:FL=1
MVFKVSIVMPAYNCEKSIVNSINSILNQDYLNWELIIVDDGSKDGTYKICKQFAEKDTRIKIFKQENKGPSSARNLALSKISGELLMFVDADDTIVPNAFNILVSNFNDKKIDACIYSWNIVQNGMKKAHKFSHKEIRADKEKFFRNIAFSSDWNRYSGGYPWNKIWRLSSISKNGMIFFDARVHLLEDRLFALAALNKVNNIKVINIPLYNYVIEDNSTSHVSDNRAILLSHLEFYKAINFEKEFIQQYHPSAIDVADKALLQEQINCLWVAIHNNSNLEKKKIDKIRFDFYNTKFIFLSLKYTVKYLYLVIKLKRLRP